eukprot:1736765-Pleurochrysis_carterae.AAC.1
MNIHGFRLQFISSTRVTYGSYGIWSLQDGVFEGSGTLNKYTRTYYLQLQHCPFAFTFKIKFQLAPSGLSIVHLQPSVILSLALLKMELAAERKIHMLKVKLNTGAEAKTPPSASY